MQFTGKFHTYVDVCEGKSHASRISIYTLTPFFITLSYCSISFTFSSLKVLYNVLQPAKRHAYAQSGDNVFTPVERELIFDIVSSCILSSFCVLKVNDTDFDPYILNTTGYIRL